MIDAAQRLLDNAVFIRSCIDLSGEPEDAGPVCFCSCVRFIPSCTLALHKHHGSVMCALMHAVRFFAGAHTKSLLCRYGPSEPLHE